MQTNTNQIAVHENNISKNAQVIDTNTRGISQNRQDILANSDRVNDNAGRIQHVEDRIKYVNVTENSVNIGKDTKADAQNSIAIGNRVSVHSSAKGSVAIGENARVTAGASNSVALGQNSVANEANTISVGNNNLKRRITNVADGINDTDAVNMRQLNAIGNKIGKLDSKIRGVGAMNSAMSALIPNHRSDKDTQLSLGLGTYGGESAIAVGFFHYTNEDDVMFNVAASHSSEAGTAVRAGVTWGF